MECLRQLYGSVSSWTWSPCSPLHNPKTFQELGGVTLQKKNIDPGRYGLEDGFPLEIGDFHMLIY